MFALHPYGSPASPIATPISRYKAAEEASVPARPIIPFRCLRYLGSAVRVPASVFLPHHDIRGRMSGGKIGHSAEMNERPKLGAGEGGVNDCFWVVVTVGRGGCFRPIVLKNFRSPDGEP